MRTIDFSTKIWHPAAFAYAARISTHLDPDADFLDLTQLPSPTRAEILANEIEASIKDGDFLAAIRILDILKDNNRGIFTTLHRNDDSKGGDLMLRDARFAPQLRNDTRMGLAALGDAHQNYVSMGLAYIRATEKLLRSHPKGLLTQDQVHLHQLAIVFFQQLNNKTPPPSQAEAEKALSGLVRGALDPLLRERLNLKTEEAHEQLTRAKDLVNLEAPNVALYTLSRHQIDGDFQARAVVQRHRVQAENLHSDTPADAVFVDVVESDEPIHLPEWFLAKYYGETPGDLDKQAWFSLVPHYMRAPIKQHYKEIREGRMLPTQAREYLPGFRNMWHKRGHFLGANQNAPATCFSDDYHSGTTANAFKGKTKAEKALAKKVNQALAIDNMRAQQEVLQAKMLTVISFLSPYSWPVPTPWIEAHQKKDTDAGKRLRGAEAQLQAENKDVHLSILPQNVGRWGFANKIDNKPQLLKLCGSVYQELTGKNDFQDIIAAKTLTDQEITRVLADIQRGEQKEHLSALLRLAHSCHHHKGSRVWEGTWRNGNLEIAVMFKRLGFTIQSLSDRAIAFVSQCMSGKDREGIAATVTFNENLVSAISGAAMPQYTGKLDNAANRQYEHCFNANRESNTTQLPKAQGGAPGVEGVKEDSSWGLPTRLSQTFARMGIHLVRPEAAINKEVPAKNKQQQQHWQQQWAEIQQISYNNSLNIQQNLAIAMEPGEFHSDSKWYNTLCNALQLRKQVKSPAQLSYDDRNLPDSVVKLLALNPLHQNKHPAEIPLSVKHSLKDVFVVTPTHTDLTSAMQAICAAQESDTTSAIYVDTMRWVTAIAYTLQQQLQHDGRLQQLKDAARYDGDEKTYFIALFTAIIQQQQSACPEYRLMVKHVTTALGEAINANDSIDDALTSFSAQRHDAEKIHRTHECRELTCLLRVAMKTPAMESAKEDLGEKLAQYIDPNNTRYSNYGALQRDVAEEVATLRGDIITDGRSLRNHNCFEALQHIAQFIPVGEEHDPIIMRVQVLARANVDFDNHEEYGKLYTLFLRHMEDNIDSNKKYQDQDDFDNVIAAIYANPNLALQCSYDMTEGVLDAVSSTSGAVESKVTRRLGSWNGFTASFRLFNWWSETPQYQGSLVARFIGTFSRNYKPQAASLASIRSAAKETPTEYRMGTQAQRHDGKARVSPLFEAWLRVQANNAEEGQITHVYFNNLGYDRKDQEGKKEKALSHALHNLENSHQNIAVITLPADKHLMNRNLLHSSGTITRQDAVENILRSPDFHMSKKLENSLFPTPDDDEIRHNYDNDEIHYVKDTPENCIDNARRRAKKRKLDPLMTQSLIDLGFNSESNLTPAQQQALAFHFFKYHFTKFALEKLKPAGFNISCKDGIDRSGVASAWFNLIKSINRHLDKPREHAPMSERDFQQALHAAATMVKGRGLNHHREVIWNVVDCYVNAQQAALENSDAAWLIAWRDKHCPKKQRKRLVSDACIQAKRNINDLTDSDAKTAALAVIDEAVELYHQGHAKHTDLLTVVRQTEQLMQSPTHQRLAAYEALSKQLHKRSACQTLAGAMILLVSAIPALIGLIIHSSFLICHSLNKSRSARGAVVPPIPHQRLDDENAPHLPPAKKGAFYARPLRYGWEKFQHGTLFGHKKAMLGQAAILTEKHNDNLENDFQQHINPA